MHEIVSVHVGEAGLKIGQVVWQLYCLEHNLDLQGYSVGDDKNESGYVDRYFWCNGGKKYTARGVFVDLEPNIIDQIRIPPSSIFHPQQFIWSQEDASNNFARGFYLHDDSIIENLTNQIRRQLENCDSFQGMQLFHSFGGGTGSGLTSNLLQILRNDFAIPASKLQSYGVIPPGMGTSLDIYNSVLSLQYNMIYGGLSFLFDNDALYRIAIQNLKIDYRMLSARNKDLTWHQILNQILAHCVSGITSGFRFESTINKSLDDMYRNIVLDHLKYPVVSYAPFVNPAYAEFERNTSQSVSKGCLGVNNRVLKLDHLKQHIANGTFQHSSCENSCYSHKFGKAEPDLLKQGNVCQNLKILPNDKTCNTTVSSCLIANSLDIVQLWTSLRKNFDKLFKHKAFLHWYLNEGMEVDQFVQARQYLLKLETEYNNFIRSDKLFYI